MNTGLDKPILRGGRLLALTRSVASVALPLLLLAAFLSLAAKILTASLDSAGALELPPRLAEAHVPVAILVVAGLCVYIHYDFQSQVDGSAPRRLGGDAGLDAVVSVVAVYLAILVFLVGVFPAGWTIVRHLRRPRQRGVLYLRRFAGRGDTAIMRLLFRAVPSGVPVAFIAGPASKPASWDPLLLVFAGLRLSRPWANVPLFLKSDDQTWKDDIRNWIADSKAIVLDSSEHSLSVSAEEELIVVAGAGDRTIIILHERGERIADMRLPQRSRVVFYELSWAAAFPRIGVGILAVFSAGFIVIGPLGAIASVLIAASLLLQPTATRQSRDCIRRALLDLLDGNKVPAHRMAR